MSTVAIACPYPLDSQMGNVVSAERIAGILSELGHEVRLMHGWDGLPADVFLGLHAVKGAAAAQAFHEAHPSSRVIVLLTGTDLYRDLEERREVALPNLARADRLVVMTETGLMKIPVEYRDKTVVIPKSLAMPEILGSRDAAVFGIAVVGHLRAVKNSFQAVEVVSQHPEWESVRVWQIGAALTEEFAVQAREWESREPRYKWVGKVPRFEGLAWMKRSALAVNSSWMEGAPSAVLEAMSLGVPVLASAVEGNVGLLGDTHEGLFPPGSDEDLASLLQRGLQDPSFLDALRTHGRARAELFSRETEARGWESLLAEMA